MDKNLEEATFAGGCFWCIESAFIDVPGVSNVTSGYTGGTFPNPTYNDIHTKDTGHVEAVKIIFDPNRVSYEQLLDLFWLQIDPTDPSGQFADRGEQYKTVIFYHNKDQLKKALKSKQELDQSGKYDKPIVTEIRPALEFYEAEEYHQEYAKKNPLQYKMYVIGSGREAYKKSRQQ